MSSARAGSTFDLQAPTSEISVTQNPKTPVRSLVQVISQSAGDLGKGIEEVPRPEALFAFCPLRALGVGFWVSGLLII